MTHTAAYLALFLGVLPGASETASLPGDALLRGRETPSGRFAATGAILAYREFGPSRVVNSLCTGTLIAEDVVLTAAHCFGEDDMQLVFTLEPALGTVNAAFGEQNSVDLVAVPDASHEIASFTRHPDYLAGDPTADVGLIFLKNPIYGHPVAAIVEADDAEALKLGAILQVVGYGIRDEDDPRSVGTKHHGALELDGYNPDAITLNTPTGSDSTGPQKCIGDSGGPSFIVIDDGKAPSQRIAGITSRARRKTSPLCGSGSVEVRVDQKAQWIRSTMIAACSSGERASCTFPIDLAEPRENLGCTHTPGGSLPSLGLICGLLAWFRRRTYDRHVA